MVMDLVLDPDVITTFTDFAYVNAIRPNVSAVWSPTATATGTATSARTPAPSPRSPTSRARRRRHVVTKKTTTQRTLALTFVASIPGSTFRCGLDGKAAKPCLSPYKVKAAVGRHTVVVTAVSPAGIPDASPASTKFRVPAKRKH